MTSAITVRPAQPDDFEGWKPLWDGYNAFYGREGATAPDAVRWTTELGATHLGLEQSALDAATMAAGRRAGVAVAAWTVNDEVDMRRMIDLRVDVLITDQPDVALRLLGR